MVNKSPTMLWFDNDPKTSPEQKIENAVRYYRSKYKQEPNFCLVSPGQNAAITTGVPNLTIESKPYVRPHDFHIGIRDGESDHLRQNQLRDTQ